jgi:ribonuclease Z
MKLTISGYSTALFATWYFIDELGILLDAGDGLTASLLQKSRKVTHAFISHADRDHLTGLVQFNQLNAREGYPIIHYPASSLSFPFMADFTQRFDPHTGGTLWRAVTPRDEIKVKDDIVVQPFRNSHVPAPENTWKSLGYKIFQTKRKLKPELAGLAGEQIRQYALEHGKESTSVEVRTNLLTYSGDTPVEDPARYDGAQILIHEATFLGDDGDLHTNSHRNKHSRLETVIEMVSGIHIEKLVLGHFSSRYSAEEIDRDIQYLCNKYAINIPVYRILPGQTVFDILNGQPVNR